MTFIFTRIIKDPSEDFNDRLFTKKLQKQTNGQFDGRIAYMSFKENL